MDLDLDLFGCYKCVIKRSHKLSISDCVIVPEIIAEADEDDNITGGDGNSDKSDGDDDSDGDGDFDDDDDHRSLDRNSQTSGTGELSLLFQLYHLRKIY